MELTRRQTMAFAAGATAVALLPLPAFAAENGYKEKIAEFTGGADVAEGGVEIGAPEIAENGNTVPIEVRAEGATEILVLAAGNPRPEIAIFRFGKNAVPAASTRIRLAETQDLVAVAKMADGSFKQATRTVKVTIGGCGG